MTHKIAQVVTAKITMIRAGSSPIHPTLFHAVWNFRKFIASGNRIKSWKKVKIILESCWKW